MVWHLVPETVRKISLHVRFPVLGFSSTSLLSSCVSGFCQVIFSLFRAFAFSLFLSSLLLSSCSWGWPGSPFFFLSLPRQADSGVRRHRHAGASQHSIHHSLSPLLSARAGSSPSPSLLLALSSLSPSLSLFFFSFFRVVRLLCRDPSMGSGKWMCFVLAGTCEGQSCMHWFWISITGACNLRYLKESTRELSVYSAGKWMCFVLAGTCEGQSCMRRLWSSVTGACNLRMSS